MLTAVKKTLDKPAGEISRKYHLTSSILLNPPVLSISVLSNLIKWLWNWNWSLKIENFFTEWFFPIMPQRFLTVSITVYISSNIYRINTDLIEEYWEVRRCIRQDCLTMERIHCISWSIFLISKHSTTKPAILSWHRNSYVYRSTWLTLDTTTEATYNACHSMFTEKFQHVFLLGDIYVTPKVTKKKPTGYFANYLLLCYS